MKYTKNNAQMYKHSIWKFRLQDLHFKKVSENWMVKEANVAIDVPTLSQHDTVRYDLLLWLAAQTMNS